MLCPLRPFRLRSGNPEGCPSQRLRSRHAYFSVQVTQTISQSNRRPADRDSSYHPAGRANWSFLLVSYRTPQRPTGTENLQTFQINKQKWNSLKLWRLQKRNIAYSLPKNHCIDNKKMTLLLYNHNKITQLFKWECTFALSLARVTEKCDFLRNTEKKK